MDTHPVNLRLPRQLINAVEAYRRELPDIPTRPEAIRRILQDWFTAQGRL